MEPKKNFMRTLGIASIIITLLLGGIWYVTADIGGRTDAIGVMRLDMQKREASIAALAQLQSDAEKARRYLPQMERLRTTREQLLGFSTDIGFLARQAGFSGTPKFKEATASSAGDLQKTSFSLALEGSSSSSNMSTFLELVERSPYFVRFESINTSWDDGVLRATMDGYVISF